MRVFLVASAVILLAGAVIVTLMLPDRPYHRALTREEAAEQVRQGRGTQFAPDVVDAFFQVLRRGFDERSATEQPMLEAVG